ncbi:GTP pyrophosphokinase [Breznakiella homolactica]|uniref:GTP pyrophosphokinase family protein n=1 Tax=Breznakiella homolactica TaxID=2798577 RepID=A0A7T7XMP6_9SPIR|nr:GTP pyrophosphokinase family protein [Breznakiella homolactica]QQO09189.1 GTP pyrophosphokinase family protein [Breznakiella homolactica]
MISEKQAIARMDADHPLLKYIELEDDTINGIVAMAPIYRGALREVSTKLDNIDYEFQTLYDHNPIHHMESRIKSPRSILEKLNRRNIPVTMENMKREILDIAGIRVVCNYTEDIFKLAELLIAQEDIELVYVHNYINEPKECGYRSFHLVVKVPVFLSVGAERVPVEVQIRTIAMDMWASLEHEIRYKATKEVSPEAEKRLKLCADILARTDMEMQEIYKECVKREEDASAERKSEVSAVTGLH